MFRACERFSNFELFRGKSFSEQLKIIAYESLREEEEQKKLQAMAGGMTKGLI